MDSPLRYIFFRDFDDHERTLWTLVSRNPGVRVWSLISARQLGNGCAADNIQGCHRNGIKLVASSSTTTKRGFEYRGQAVD